VNINVFAVWPSQGVVEAPLFHYVTGNYITSEKGNPHCYIPLFVYPRSQLRVNKWKLIGCRDAVSQSIEEGLDIHTYTRIQVSQEERS
jgi:hypothetical protein